MKVIEFKKNDEAEKILAMALSDVKDGNAKHMVIVAIDKDDAAFIWSTQMPDYVLMGILAVASHEAGLVGGGIVDPNEDGLN